jgi:copper homeostasis protein
MAAERGGAGRIELCDALYDGGTTPSAGTIALCRERASVPIHVLVRPRGGDFLYSDAEIDVMRRDIAFARELGADGVVIGALQRDGRVDARRTAHLVERARPMRVTFHRAFDLTRDADEALDVLIDAGVDIVLTSGRAPTAVEGASRIAAFVRRARGRIGVLAGGGITAENVARVVEETGVREVHARGAVRVRSAMEFRNRAVTFAKALPADDHDRTATSEAEIARLAASLARSSVR